MKLVKEGIAMVASIPTIAITTKSSTKVKPALFFFNPKVKNILNSCGFKKNLVNLVGGNFVVSYSIHFLTWDWETEG
jgi:hypothetical protein